MKKCWKKVGKENWKKKDKFHKRNDINIMIQDYVNGFKVWKKYGDGDVIDKGFFKTKSQARRFVNKYMKENC